MSILDLYCSVDTFWQAFEPVWEREQVASGQRRRKRAIIESVNDQLKNICQIEHTRQRSPYNFLVHLLAGLVAYCHQPNPRCTSIGLLTA